MNAVHVNIKDGYIIEQKTEWDDVEEKYIHIKKKVKKTQFYEDYNSSWIVEIDGDKIICLSRKASACVVTEQRTSFDLEDGTLVFPKGGRTRDVEFRPKIFCEWLNENNLTQSDKNFLYDWSAEDKIVMYGRSANCGAGTAAHIIVTDGKLVSQEKESAHWVEDFKTSGNFDEADSLLKYVIANPTYIIKFSAMHYRNNHNSEHILYTNRWGDNIYKYKLDMLPEDIKEKLKNFSDIMPSCIYTEVKAPKEEPKKSSDGEATHLFG